MIKTVGKYKLINARPESKKLIKDIQKLQKTKEVKVEHKVDVLQTALTNYYNSLSNGKN